MSKAINYVHITSDDIIVCYKGKEYSFIELYRKMDDKTNIVSVVGIVLTITGIVAGALLVVPYVEIGRIREEVQKTEQRNKELEQRDKELEQRNEELKDRITELELELKLEIERLKNK